MTTGIVTDSTGYLTGELLPDGVRVVPVAVVLDGRTFDEGTQISPGQVADALRRKASVSTSRPAPARFADAYSELAAAGHDSIVSVHLSAELSGTHDSARLAAQSSPVPVTVIDSRTVAAALGFAARAASESAGLGMPPEEVAAAARQRAERSRTWLVVDSLDALRRGGRIGSAQALVGSALMVKPILEIRDGAVTPLEKQRTMGRALARMAELVCDYAKAGPADVIVQHCAAQAKATDLAETLRQALPLSSIHLIEVGAVISAHVGLGTVSVAVCPR